MGRKRAYRRRPTNQDELIELVAGTSTPTGRVFRLAKENEDLAFKEVVELRDSLSGKLISYVYSHNE